MRPTNNTARVAGVLYLLLGTAPFSFIYIPRTLIVPENAAATASKILTHETLFRLGIVNELFIAIVSIFLVMTLYRLFNGVNKMHAMVMVILGALVSVPITFVNVVNDIAALTLLRGPDFLSVFDKRQLDALALLFLRLHGQGLLVEQILWGLWLVPFGLLVFRSGFIPRIFGVLLIVNCVPYVTASVTSLLWPGYGYNALGPTAVILETGELWIMLWLLIRGAKVQPALIAATG